MDNSTQKTPYSTYDSRLIFSAIALIVLTVAFWTGSRYPALNEKALMGAETPLTGLAFDIILDVFPDSSLWWEIIANVANWLYTNLRGMIFGVLFGAGILTLLSVVQKKTFENGFANAALGTAIGAPLGVCVNCAAPIALGLHMGRMRLETTLSALIASPTLNVVVVTMSFALLPLHIAATKLAIALLLVLIIIPLLCKYVLIAETSASGTTVGKFAEVDTTSGLTGWIARALTPRNEGPAVSGFWKAGTWFVRSYGRNLFFIFIISVPMMFLAAFLAALLSTTFESGILINALPSRDPVAVIFAMILIALVASIAPAPIALDVILTAVLLGAGLRTDYATVAIIALGSISVYAFFVLWRAVSLRTALVVWLTTVALAVFGGLIANRTAKFEAKYYQRDMMINLMAAPTVDIAPISALTKADNPEELAGRLAEQTIDFIPLTARVQTSGDGDVSIKRAMNIPSAVTAESSGGNSAFTRVPGQEIGFEETGRVNPIRKLAPEMMMGGIGAGDINGDGWIDVVVSRPTGAKGLSIYLNLSGEFKRVFMNMEQLADKEVINTALVDLNNDAALDLVVSTKWHGVFVYYNRGSRFQDEHSIHLKGEKYVIAMSLGFADLDQDGYVDIVLGNWVNAFGSAGWGKVTPQIGDNQVAWNQNGQGFEIATVAGSKGQTLSTLISDLDGDGRLDLIKGDDVAHTDQVIHFDKNRKTKPISGATQPFSYMMFSSMSYDVGDWNNDLIRDYYGGQIAHPSQSDREASLGNGMLMEICKQHGQDSNWPVTRVRQCAAELKSIDEIIGSKASLIGKKCGGVTRKDDETMCLVMSVLRSLRARLHKGNDDRRAKAVEACQRRMAKQPFGYAYCDALMINVAPKLRGEALAAEHSAPNFGGNILMTGQADGQFIDDASVQGVRNPGWTWNSKFVDLDQNGWQDLLVMTGVWLSPSRSHTNRYYKNTDGRFSDTTKESGFFDVVPSYSYVAFDYDRDGDIDIIRAADAITMIVHRNERPAGNALWVHLRDTKSNSFAIGASVIICVDGAQPGDSSGCQLRDIKASGGFMSFDPIAAHFGLGNAKQVSRIEITWPDGEVSKIEPKNLTHGEIVVSRN